MSLLLHKRSVSTPFTYKRKGFPSCHSSCLRLLLFIHLMKPNHFASCCFFSCVAVPLCVCLQVWRAGQAYVCVYIYGSKMCVILCMCAWGGLWHASLVRGFHQQKSIPLYSAACSACLYWVNIGWTSFMLHPFACCMNTICWCPVGTASIHLHCFYAPTWREPIHGHSPSDFQDQNLCTWEVRDAEESIATTVWYEYFIYVLYE